MVLNKFKEIRPIPFYFESNVTNDVKVLSEFFKKVPNRFDIGFYNDIRYLIGMRYHSLVFSTQCGIPFISLSYQPKNDTFCNDMGLNELCMDIYNIKELENKIDYVINHYRKIREHMISFREKCIKEINIIIKSISAKGRVIMYKSIKNRKIAPPINNPIIKTIIPLILLNLYNKKIVGTKKIIIVITIYGLGEKLNLF